MASQNEIQRQVKRDDRQAHVMKETAPARAAKAAGRGQRTIAPRKQEGARQIW